MRIVKEGTRTTPKVSLVLLDWSVRESFHLLRYLERQELRRDDFEVLVVEYYGRESPLARSVHEPGQPRAQRRRAPRRD